MAFDLSSMIGAIRDWANSKFITEIPIGSENAIGGVKADGTTTTIDSDGTIHASSGGETGTSDYNALDNKPSVGGVTLSGNKTLSELGIQPEGNYLTEETDPTVPEWAKASSKPSYTADEVGADASGSASAALVASKEYTDEKVAELVDGAPETLNTLKEISDALVESEDAVEAINTAIGNKLDKAGDSLNNTVTFTQASTRENIKSTETHATLFGKIAKWFSDIKTVAFTGAYSDLSGAPTNVSQLTNDSGYITGYTETDPTVPSWAKNSTKPSYTASEVGLGNVPNVTTDNQTPTFAQASSRANISSGEKLSVLFGKIMKWYADLKTVAFTGSYSDLTNQPTIPTKTSQLTNDSGYITEMPTITILDSIEEIDANTESGKAAGALALKEVNDSLPNFVYDETTGEITGYTTSIGGADTVFPFSSGLTMVEHIITSGTSSAWTEFELEGTPKLIYAYRNTGNSARKIYFFADVENESIISYGNTSSSSASVNFSTDFETLKSETGVGKNTSYIRIYDGKIGLKITESSYVPTESLPLTLVYLY